MHFGWDGAKRLSLVLLLLCWCILAGKKHFAMNIGICRLKLQGGINCNIANCKEARWRYFQHFVECLLKNFWCIHLSKVSLELASPFMKIACVNCHSSHCWWWCA